MTLPSYSTLEIMFLTVCHGAINAALLTLYRPGSRPITDEFFTEFADVLERCSKYCRCYIVGDINIHLDDVSSAATFTQLRPARMCPAANSEQESSA